jgi:hypothetical protein
MTPTEIHNIWLHMSGKSEGIMEAGGESDFPVLFATAILQYDRMERGADNLDRMSKPNKRPLPKEWVGLTAYEQSFVYDQVKQIVDSKPFWVRFADAIEAKLKEKNT